MTRPQQPLPTNSLDPDALDATCEAESFVEHIEATTSAADQVRLRAERLDLVRRIDLAENLLGLAVFAADGPRIQRDLETLQGAWRDARAWLEANPSPEKQHAA